MGAIYVQAWDLQGQMRASEGQSECNSRVGRRYVGGMDSARPGAAVGVAVDSWDQVEDCRCGR